MMKKFNKTKEVKALAREQVGQVRKTSVIKGPKGRKKSKYPEKLDE